MAARILALATAVFVATQLLTWVGLGLRAQELVRLHDQHLRNLVGELTERLQTELEIGLTLADNSQLQALLEDEAGRMPQLLALEVLSDSGVSLFSSDRGVRGQPAPEEWLQALNAAPLSWQATRQDERSIGVALHDSTGKVGGYLVLSYHPGDGAEDAAPALEWLSWVAGALAALSAGLCERRARARLNLDLRLLREETKGYDRCDAALAAWHSSQARECLSKAQMRARAIAEAQE